MANTYDVKCYEIAKVFLADESQLEAEERELLTVELAQEIWQTIEKFTNELHAGDSDDLQCEEDDDGRGF